MKYYAAVNRYATEISHGFGNTWDVYVFDSKGARDNFVDNDHRINTKAIKKSEVTEYATNWFMGHNEYIKPRPFTGEYWGIDKWDALDSGIEGFIGTVAVCRDGTMERLF